MIRDAILYGSLIPKGGELLFHDATPDTSNHMRQDYAGLEGHHDVAEAAKGYGVRKVLDAGLLGEFRLVQASANQPHGGVEVLEKR